MTPNEDDRGGLLSASAGERVYHCNGALLAAKRAKERGEEPPTEALGKQGEKIHAAMEEEDEEEAEEGEESSLERYVVAEPERLTEEEKEIVSNLERIGQEALGDWQLERAVDDPEIKREERMWIRNEDFEPLASAKTDLSARAGAEGFVLDYKSGFKPVTDPKHNIQLRLQALSLWHDSDKELQHIRVAAAQYRLVGKKLYADYDLEALQMAERELQLVLWRANQPDAPRVPGRWCEYCPARGSCREALAYAMLPVPVMATGRGVDPQDLTKEDVIELIAKLSPEELAYVWDRSFVIEKILRAVKYRLGGLPDKMLDKLGLERYHNPPMRKVKDIQKAWNALREDLQFGDFLDCCKVSIGSLEKLFSETTLTKHGTLKEGRAVLAKLLDESHAVLRITKRPSVRRKEAEKTKKLKN